MLEKLFVVDSLKSEKAVFEVSVRDVLPLEQPSVNWVLGHGERLLKVVDGPQKLVGAKIFSFFCYKTIEEAIESAKKEIKIDIQRACDVSGSEFDSQLFEVKCREISVVNLG